MAAFELAKLLPVTRQLPDEAQEIGRLSASCDLTAMRVGFDGNKELVYLGETPIRFIWAWRIMDYGDGQRHRWWRVEVKAATANDDIQPGHHLVVAEHPYFNGWSHQVAFKRRSKKSRDHFLEPSRTIAEPTPLIEWLEGLQYDYWEKGDYLTAGISEPQLPHCPGKAIKNTHRRIWLFGVCHDFTACESALGDSVEVKTLLDQTKRNSIRFWYTKALLSQRPKLSEAVIAERYQLMGLSIRQALAGPHEESDKWVGKAVTRKVDQIYRDHLNNLNRVEAAKVAESDASLDSSLDQQALRASRGQKASGANGQ